MSVLRFEQFRRNSFRLLGLSASAGQAEVLAAARRMRLLASDPDAPSTSWDLPWLGQLPRQRSDIEQAIARLNDPSSRLTERIFWFVNEPPDRSMRARALRAAKTVSDPRLPAANPAVFSHDSALLDVARLHIADSALKKVESWQHALARLCQSTRSEEYSQWLWSVERNGEFEIPATLDEIDITVSALPELVAQSLAEQVRAKLDEDDIGGVLAGISVLSGLPADATVEARREIFDRVEDLLSSRCNRLCDKLFHGITWGSSSSRAMVARHNYLCREATKDVRRSIDPLFSILRVDPEAADLRLERVSIPAARAMRNLGNGWVRSGKLRRAGRVLRHAQNLAKSTAFEQKLKEDLNNVKRQRWSRFLGKRPQGVKGARTEAFACFS